MVNYLRNLRRLTPAQINVWLLGLSGFTLLVAVADLLFRHVLGLPKDVALYLSILSVVLLLSLWLQCWQATGRVAKPPTEQTQQEEH